jgi:superfamily II DNA or RNA helicase
MPKIVVGRRICQVVEEFDASFIKALDRELSFFVQGAEHSKAYQGYIDTNGKQVTWDGRKHLLSSSLKFEPGLLNRVIRFYTKNNKEFEIIDHRPHEDPVVPLDISNRLIELKKSPYQYQIDAADIARQNDRGIVRIATGGGKTLVIALVTAKLNKKTIIYVIGKDLLYQMHEFFESIFQQKIGIIGDGKCEIADINIATIWTVAQALGIGGKKSEEDGDEKNILPEKYREIKDLLKNTQVHICDECHMSASTTLQGIYQNISPENLYGFSASPYRDDGADLLIENFLGNKIVDISAKTLISGGFLVPPKIRFLTVPKYDGKKAHYKIVYQNYIVKNKERNDMISRGAQKLVEQGFQTLVLFHSIEHGKILYDQISKMVPCALLSGEDDIIERNKVKKKLEDRKISCIISSKIFDIGIDLPSLSGLIIGGAGKSSVRALQRIGRVIRKHEGKTMAAVLEFADQAPYLSDHSEKRRDIYLAEEFEVKWPQEKQNQ